MAHDTSPKSIEKAFTDRFVRRERRERFFAELSSVKKRHKALNRLCHRFDEILDSRFLIKIPKPNSDPDAIAETLRSYGSPDECYAISANPDIDQKVLPLVDALREAVGFGFPSIIVCKPTSLAYFEAEQEYGAPPRYLLVRE